MTARKKNAQTPDLLNDYHLLSFDILDSTNEEAKRLAKAGGGHGAFIWAKRQTAGKGRMGRPWVSNEGNLFVSVLLKPEKPMESLPQLSFVAACAVMESLKALLPENARLACKWPNDIVLDDRKLGGILLESLSTPEGGQWVVVGVGVNVESFPADAEFPAGCLKDAGVELVSAKIILSRFIHHFIECYNGWNRKGFAATRKYWMAHAWRLGEPVRVRLPEGELRGAIQGIDAEGQMQLEVDGKTRLVRAGDVFGMG